MNKDICYNVMGRLSLKEIRVVISIYHLAMKFLTSNGIDSIRDLQLDSKECYNRALHMAKELCKHLQLIFDGERELHVPEALLEVSRPVKKGFCNVIMIVRHQVEKPCEDVSVFYGVDDPDPLLKLEAPVMANSKKLKNFKKDSNGSKTEARGSEVRDEVDLDPKIPKTKGKVGAAEDTISISVDKSDPTKNLKNRKATGT